jgi:hypothetical protein
MQPFRGILGGLGDNDQKAISTSSLRFRFLDFGLKCCGSFWIFELRISNFDSKRA